MLAVLLLGQTAAQKTTAQHRTLEEKIAASLGWNVAETRSLSAQSLRELVRPVSPALAAEITDHIQSGYYVKGTRFADDAHEADCDCMACLPWTY